MIVALIARSTTARTSSRVRPARSFQWVSVRTLAPRTWGAGTGGRPGVLGWPREAHSASYTASTARPTSADDPARARAPTRQDPSTCTGLPPASPVTSR